ncbi:MAG: DNA double-strand break repair nuclease NurA [Anaerolineales bacterium]|nr:DNA double-strand break repair nuclease NurA [Anaerolineales bacterium]
MTLELNQLSDQVQALSATAAERLASLERQRPAAEARLRAIGLADDELQGKVRAALRYRWAGAIPAAEPVDAAFPCPPHPARANVLAADGSQVYPDRHGVALYYLINVGSIAFRHGSGEAPRVASRPAVFYEDADLYEEEGRQKPVEKIDAERDRRELGELARLAAANADAPAVALLDNGLLLYFSLQAQDRAEIKRELAPYLAHLSALRDSGAAVAGIVDRPRAAGVARLLHLHTLPMEALKDHADLFQQDADFRHLTDGALFADRLQPGERSALFENGSPANLDHFQPAGHSVFFFYLNPGPAGRHALLRVEVPEWVAHDPARLDLVHAALVEQCRATGGFPYVLMRAHELAVVTVAERRELEQMVVAALVRRGLSLSVSHKAQGKAWTGAGRRRYP